MKKGVLVLVLLMIFSCVSFAESEEVMVTIPQFDVKINDVKFDSEFEQYPFIKYKGITYLPMTWNMSKSLGLSLKWSREEGLRINPGTDATLELPEGGYKNSVSQSYKVKVITDKVTINGEVIDNATAEYPLLNFKNITYFPMTYKYMVNDFNCQYKWNNETGLSIKANPSLKMNLPKPEVLTTEFTYDEVHSDNNVTKGIMSVQETIGNYIYLGFRYDYNIINDDYFAMNFTCFDDEGQEVVTIYRSMGQPLKGASGIVISVPVNLEFSKLVLEMKTYPGPLFNIMNNNILKNTEFEIIKAEDVTLEMLKADGAVRLTSLYGYNDALEVGEMYAYEYANNVGEATIQGVSVARFIDADGNSSFGSAESAEILADMSDLYLEDHWMFFTADDIKRQYSGDILRLYNEDDELIKLYVIDYN